MKYEIRQIGQYNFITEIKNGNVKRTKDYILYLFKVGKAIGATSIEFEKEHDFDERDLGHYTAHGKDKEKEIAEIIKFEPEFASMSAKEKTTGKTVNVLTNIRDGVECSLRLSALNEKAVKETADKIVAL